MLYRFHLSVFQKALLEFYSFVFGHDNYTSFWICTFEPDSEGLSFASWDHDIEEIDEPIDADIVSFFKDIEMFYGDEGMIPPFC